ncbi:MAG TPA: OmpA family protein [Bacteroidia bacterium]|nr:OmpA family protein [Bacteroidia bacterium]
MKYLKNTLAFSLLVSFLLSCGPTNKMSKQDKGVAIGAGSGAVTGGVIGHAAGNTALGAVIGGVVGGVAGGLIGHKMDKQEKELAAIKEAKVEKINNGEGLKVTFDAGILFETNSSTLSAQSQDALSKFSQSLQNNAETKIVISGHTDNTGTDAINEPLSGKRAESVANYLISKGVSRDRMTTVGNGSKQPVADNSTDEGRTKNRRVEIVIVANEKMINDAKEGNLK